MFLLIYFAKIWIFLNRKTLNFWVFITILCSLIYLFWNYRTIIQPQSQVNTRATHKLLNDSAVSIYTPNILCKNPSAVVEKVSFISYLYLFHKFLRYFVNFINSTEFCLIKTFFSAKLEKWKKGFILFGSWNRQRNWKIAQSCWCIRQKLSQEKEGQHTFLWNEPSSIRKRTENHSKYQQWFVSKI